MTISNPQPAIRPGLVDRVKNIILKPATEWDRIDAEPATIQGIYTGYVMILAAIGPICQAICSIIFFHWRSPVWAIASAIISYVLTLVVVGLVALLIDALAPTFGGQKDRVQAFKVAAYSSTPGWVAGVFQLVPFLGILAGLAALYGIYLLYLGLPKLMKTPQDKAIPYTATVVIAFIVAFGIIFWIMAMIAAATLVTAGAAAYGAYHY